MGGGSSGGKTTTEVKLPQSISDAATEYANRSRFESRKPYVAYTGKRVADLNADELASFDMTRSSVGQWQPQMEKSESLADLAGRQWSGDVAAEYMNPYTKNVTDIAARELVKRNDIARRGANASLVEAGAFGGAQHGVQAAEQEKNLQQGLGDLYATGQAAAYDNALSAFGADRAAALGASGQMGDIATRGSALTGADIERLMTSGAAQQSQTQAELDADYAAWKEAQDHEWNQLNRGVSILGATPYGQSQLQKGGGQDQTGQYVSAGVSAAATVAAAAIIIA